MKKSCVLLVLAILAVAFGGRPLFAAGRRANQERSQGVQTGVFYHFQGLSYRTRTLSGTTNSTGEFQYRSGETITFSIGDFVLGSAPGAKLMTSASLVLGVNGDIKKLRVPQETNLARFIQSLGKSEYVDNGIVITPQTAEVVSRYAGKINFAESEAVFTTDPNVVSLFKTLHKMLRSGPEARNYVRWALLGVHRKIDVKIPLRNGSYVLADVFRPIAPGKYPALVSLTSYGKAFGRTCICNYKQHLARAAGLDDYFQGNPRHMSAINEEIPNPQFWVPHGYVIVRVDAPGGCNNPGVLSPYSVEETNAYYDSIEWTTKQAWSDGNIGILGSSLFGINQLLVAQIHPPGLKALIDIGGDNDRYRTVVHAGGILNSKARFGWWHFAVQPRRCLNQKTYEYKFGPKVVFWLDHPFDNPAYYGPYSDNPPLEISADLSKIHYPLLEVGPLEHEGSEHVRGSVYTYMWTPSKYKMLRESSADFNGAYFYTATGRKLFLAWFDHWLKGKDNHVMTTFPKVRVTVRTGHGGWFWQSATAYPLTNTKYTKLYLNAQPSRWSGNGRQTHFLELSPTAPSTKASKSYSADVKNGPETPSCWKPGISFISQPLTHDMELIGFIKLHVWVSSSSPDMDVFASLRVMGPNGKQIPYSVSSRGKYYPIGKGWLRASYRALDPKLTTMYLPIHLDTKAAYAPLKSPSEIVPIDVQLEPTTAVIHKGDRIRLDIQPVDGCDWGTPHPLLAYREAYHRGATNTIYTGPAHVSYIQLPVIPAGAAARQQALK